MTSSCQIRPETPEDYAAIAAVVTAAFGRADEARLIDRIRESDRYRPELALVAVDGDAIVGHVLLSGIDLVGAETWPVLGLAPLAVHPDHQRQGIGSALTQGAIAAAEAQAAPLIVVLGHADFYSRFGFEISTDHGIESPFPVPPEVFRIQRLTHYRDEYRGLVQYPAAFQGL
ncbi:GNAT family N-acetyltransferase [Geitlerinema sp. PCC 7407]|uniref:GNAT family N-acetyltransferase n=1 Tax=Geitlerinema sp. PCC 7407 TaxID=1173025 RepID=UPI00029FC446|nr:N-acetyltransferase [Geitlerinema sp. PCC 7407]AFY67602.1 GCN5-related N-acetyltransferase [Geitlerinema sp. PCC 7407]